MQKKQCKMKNAKMQKCKKNANDTNMQKHANRMQTKCKNKKTQKKHMQNMQNKCKHMQQNKNKAHPTKCIT